MPVQRHDELGTPTLVHDTIGYWPIPKVAHASMLAWLRKVQFRPVFGLPTSEVEQLDNFALIRHPVDRYQSSLWQMLTSRRVPDLNWRAYLEGVNRTNHERVWTAHNDEHFCHQHERIPPDCHLFKMGDWTAVTDWLAARGVVMPHPIQHIHEGRTEFRRLAVDVLDPTPILTHYQQDLTLYQETQDGHDRSH